MKQIIRAGRRGARGAALVEGVVALCMIFFGSMIAVVFLVNSGMSTFYKEKLGFITNQIALQVGQNPQMDDMAVREMARDMLNQMGIPSTDLKVKRSLATIYGRPGVAVTIVAGNLPMFGNGQVLPLTITLQDKSVALITPTPAGADAYLFSSRGTSAGYLVPLVRVPANGLGAISLPIVMK